MTASSHATRINGGGEPAPDPADTRYSVDELARVVGLSPRTIRAHQARKLLAPPVRAGRQAYYHAGHLKRLETIKSLQRQGFNLVAIEAILGARPAEPGTEALTRTVTRLAGEHPYLLHALTRHGVVVRMADRSVRMVRPMLLRCALDLHRAGVAPGSTLQVLVEVLDRLRGVADDLVLATGSRILALSPDVSRTGEAHWEDFDRNAVALAQGMAALLTEAFRVAVENSGQALVPELVADHTDVDLMLHDTAEVDTG